MDVKKQLGLLLYLNMFFLVYLYFDSDSHFDCVYVRLYTAKITLPYYLPALATTIYLYPVNYSFWLCIYIVVNFVFLPHMCSLRADFTIVEEFKGERKR